MNALFRCLFCELPQLTRLLTPRYSRLSSAARSITIGCARGKICLIPADRENNYSEVLQCVHPQSHSEVSGGPLYKCSAHTKWSCCFYSCGDQDLKYFSLTSLTFRHRASCILGQAFHYSPENAFYIFNQQIYFIIWYLLDRASLI